MSINIKEKSANFIVWKNFAYKKQGYFFVHCVCGLIRHTAGQKTFFRLPWPQFSLPTLHPCHHNRRTVEFAILRLWGSCDCDVGKLGNKNRGWKNRKCRFIVFSRDFCYQTTQTHISPSPIAITTGPSNSRYWVCVKHFWEFTYRNRRTLEFVILRIWVSWDCWQG